VKRVLFVCVENAGRSQMAQAFYERRGGEARSAGTAPAGAVHSNVADAMREVGVELGERRPQALSTADAEWADVVVTMGCGDQCPVLPGKRYVEWNGPNPAGASRDAVRAIRDEIERLVAAL
jgi:arsenate reductase